MTSKSKSDRDRIIEIGEIANGDRKALTPDFARFEPWEEPFVAKIVDRALGMFARFRMPVEPLSVRMDIAAVHGRIGLRLEEFAEADDLNFSHDIGGIYKHLNRETGDLEDCFLPRFSA